jgi:DNA polymerase-3 subunit gamma/tau
MARAVYAPAGFVRSTPSTVTLSVPNAVHRAKCEEQRQVVEAALTEYVGSSIEVELLDGGGDGATADRSDRDVRAGPDAPPAVESAASPASAPSAPRPDVEAPVDRADTSSPRTRGLAAAVALGDSRESFADERPITAVGLPDDDEVDLDDLVDAPPESVKSPIDRLAEAFPGSELIDEAG